MTQAQAIKIGVQMLWEHGLGQQGWKLVFDNAVRRAGQCKHAPARQIHLSRKVMAVRTYEGTLNTIRHEIAHALVGPHHGHDAIWSRTYRELGGTGDRVADEETIIGQIEGRYRGTCPGCGREVQMFRLPQKNRSCYQCNPLRFDETFKFQWFDTKNNRPVTIITKPRRPRKQRVRA